MTDHHKKTHGFIFFCGGCQRTSKHHVVQVDVVVEGGNFEFQVECEKCHRVVGYRVSKKEIEKMLDEEAAARKNKKR